MKIDSILNKTMKVLLVALLCVLLTIGLLFVTPVSVHAAGNDMPILPVTTFNNVDITSNGFLAFTQGSANAPMYFSCSGNYVKVFYYHYSNIYNFVFVTDTYGLYGYRCSINNDGTVNNYPSQFQITAQYPDTSTYYYQLGWPDTVSVNSSIPQYESLEAGIAAFSSVPTGEFNNLYQVNTNIDVDYNYAAIYGTPIYANTSTYCFVGQYQTVQSPTSQYCYVQTGVDQYEAVVFSSVPLTVYRAFINGQTMSSTVCTEYAPGKYYSVFGLTSTRSEFTEEPFESLSDAQEAFSGATSSGAGSASGVVSAGAISIDVPAGNVLYIKLRPGSVATLRCMFPVKSDSSVPYWSNRNSTSQWKTGVSSLPDSNTTFPLSGMSFVSWSLDTSKGVDGYGRGYYGIAQYDRVNAGWFVLFNPAYTRAVTDDVIGGNTATFNPTITVDIQYALEYHIYDLNEAILPSGNTSTSPTDYDSHWDGQYDPETDSFNHSSTNTDTSEPVVGGLNSGASGGSLSITEYLQYLGHTLSEFANDIVNLFTAPISHIRQLISAGSSFMSSISQFFTWLPEPVFNAISTALIVAVAIGVLKLFL